MDFQCWKIFVKIFHSNVNSKNCQQDTYSWYQSKTSFLADNVISDLLRLHKSSLSQHQLSEIQKMLLCHDPSQGYILFQCQDCGDAVTVHTSCNSRLCPSCGRRMTEDWANRIKNILLTCPHRHCVFTLPVELWSLMKNDRKLIAIAFSKLLDVVMNVFRHQNKGVEITPGITAVLHTFGEDMKFNVHFHCLITCGGINPSGNWVDLDFFFFEGLRKVWQYHILSAIKASLPKNRQNNIFIDKLFKDHPKGFYVWAKDTVNNSKNLLKYIARYVRHPAIAQSRILSFDGRTVTFICNKGEKGERVISMHVLEFLLALTQHIPPKGFQLIKHLGLYANRSRRKYATVICMFKRKLKLIQKKLFTSTKRCKLCNGPMKIMEIFPPTDPPRHLLLSSYAGQQRLR